MKYKILGTFTGKIEKLSSGQESAIRKRPIDKLIIMKDKILHDVVANTLFHGGDMRVVHHYSQRNYDILKKAFPEIADRFIPGSFGENIFTEELTEDDLNIGDIYQLGTARVQLTVSRRPCATINGSYEDPRILKEVMTSGHTGWFYKVLTEGEVQVGDYLEFLERPFPNMPIQKLYYQGYGKNKFDDLNFIKKCLDTGLMDKGWKPKIEDALKNHDI
jgi:MOSC domain-containing protein YiiM